MTVLSRIGGLLALLKLGFLLRFFHRAHFEDTIQKEIRGKPSTTGIQSSTIETEESMLMPHTKGENYRNMFSFETMQ